MSLIVPSLLTPDPEVSRKRALSQASATERAKLARSTSLSRSRSPCCEPRAGASVHRCPGRGRSRGVCDAGRRTSSWPVASAQPSGCRGSPHPSYPVGRDRIRHRVRRNDSPKTLADEPSSRAGHGRSLRQSVHARPHARQWDTARAKRGDSQIRGCSSIQGARSGDVDQAGCSCPWGIDRTVPRPVASSGRPSASKSILDEGHAHVRPAGEPERKRRGRPARD